MTNYVIGGASTQSRCRRPGKKVNSYLVSGAYEYIGDKERPVLSWPMAQYGPLLGFPSSHNPYTTEIVAKLCDAMSSGYASIGSYAPECSEILAEKLVARYLPHLTSDNIGVRFFSNGTDATQCAAALARYATGASQLASVGYHGGSSPTYNFPPQNGGVLPINNKGADNIDFGDYPKLRPGDDVAAIVVEVPAMDNEVDAAKILCKMEIDCKRSDFSPLLVFDDVVTGFRFGRAGALQYYSTYSEHNLRADFICLGKALSTFGKISALLGPRDIMERLNNKVFASYTFNDHPRDILDSIFTLDAYDSLGDSMYAHLDTIGSNLKIGLNEVFKARGFDATVYGHPSRTAIRSNEKPEIFRNLLDRVVDEYDVLLDRPQFVSMAHTMSDVEKTVDAVNGVLSR